MPDLLRRRGVAQLEPAIFDVDFEQRLTAAWCRYGSDGLDPTTALALRARIEAYAAAMPRDRAAVVCTAALRPALADFLLRSGIRVSVYAYGELPNEVTLAPTEVLGAGGTERARFMHLRTLDWIIVVVSLGVSFVPAIVLARRAGRNITEFFAAGRQAPWWLIGISLVATTFSTDTPNLVTNLVRDGGVAENWVWWSFLLTGMATVFFYARLWRRSSVLTDLEFYELRYAGRAASFVRGFRAIYLGLFFNCWIIATVNLALVKIAGVLFGWPRAETLAISVIVPIIFAATAGLWGVMVTDMIQFCITMSSAFAAAYFAIHAPGVGGLHGLVAHFAPSNAGALSILPNFKDWHTALGIFVIPITVLWWSVWYPGAEPGGGSYVAQRMLAARTESDALFGTFAFQVMHYALRPWPWIVVALASTIVYPTLHDIHARFPTVAPGLIGNDIAYPAMLVFLPSGFAGFMVAGIFAAYRSTIETHLNWGTSYLVHDFYQRFIRPGSSQRELVFAGRLVTALLMVVGVLLTLALDNAQQCLQPLALDRGRHRFDLLAALVLVAHQRLERSERDACVVRRLARRFSLPQNSGTPSIP